VFFSDSSQTHHTWKGLFKVYQLEKANPAMPVDAAP